MWGVGRKEQWQVEKYALIRVDDVWSMFWKNSRT